MNRSPIAAALASLAFAASLVSHACAEAPRTHTVTRIELDGRDVTSANVTVTPDGKPAEASIRRGERIGAWSRARASRS